MTPTVFIDTETSGLFEHQGAEVWEVGMILDDGAGTVTEYEWQLPVDLSRADPMALTISGFYERRGSPAANALSPTAALTGRGPTLVVAPHQMEAWAQNFARLTHGAHWVGAVPDFDSRFLGNLLRRHGATQGWHYHLICVEVLAVGFLRGLASVGAPAAAQALTACYRRDGSWDSNRLSVAVGVDPDQFDRHTALGDCRWARAIHLAVMG